MKKVTPDPISFSDLLFLLFLALKLTGHIHWSWWWITAPLWGQFIINVTLISIEALSEYKQTKRLQRRREKL